MYTLVLREFFFVSVPNFTAQFHLLNVLAFTAD